MKHMLMIYLIFTLLYIPKEQEVNEKDTRLPIETFFR